MSLTIRLIRSILFLLLRCSRNSCSRTTYWNPSDCRKRMKVCVNVWHRIILQMHSWLVIILSSFFILSIFVPQWFNFLSQFILCRVLCDRDLVFRKPHARASSFTPWSTNRINPSYSPYRVLPYMKFGDAHVIIMLHELVKFHHYKSYCDRCAANACSSKLNGHRDKKLK